MINIITWSKNTSLNSAITIAKNAPIANQIETKSTVVISTKINSKQNANQNKAIKLTSLNIIIWDETTKFNKIKQKNLVNIINLYYNWL